MLPNLQVYLVFGASFGPNPSDHVLSLPLGEDDDSGCTLEKLEETNHRILYISEHRITITGKEGCPYGPLHGVPTTSGDALIGLDGRLKSFCDAHEVPYFEEPRWYVVTVYPRA